MESRYQNFKPSLLAKKILAASLVLFMVISLLPVQYFQAAAADILEGVTLTLTAPESTEGPANSVELSNTLQLTPVGTASGSTVDISSATFSYTSSDESVATVSNTGLVTPNTNSKIGKTTITVTANGGGADKTATLVVSVIGDNIFPEGHFEDADSISSNTWIYSYTTTAYPQAQLSTDVKHSGSSSVMFVQNPAVKTNLQVFKLKNPKPIQPNKLYEISGWYRIDGADAANKYTYGGNVGEQYFKTSTSYVLNSLKQMYLSNPTGWTRISAPISAPVDVSATSITPVIYAGTTDASTTCNGTYYFDDFSINEVALDSVNLIPPTTNVYPGSGNVRINVAAYANTGSMLFGYSSSNGNYIYPATTASNTISDCMKVTSSNPEVATVSNIGTASVTCNAVAKKPGTTTITYTLSLFGVTRTATADFTVLQLPGPTGLTGVAPTSDSATDGKITGVATTMQYRAADASTYTTCTGTEITGLAPGTYYVRTAAKGTVYAGQDTNVIVPAYGAPTINGISLTTPPTKLVYKAGETLDLSGLVATATYSDGSTGTVPVTAADVSNFYTTTVTDSQPVTVTINGQSATFNISVINNDQTAPEGLAGKAPTTSANNDGKITGVTTAMEYKLSADTTYTAVTGTEITGLSTGTYNVRYAAKAGYNASADTNVDVPAYVDLPDLTAPTGLVAVIPTTPANNDGKITGTTTAMEYKLSTATTYTAVTGTEITGLVPGTYDVRYAAIPNYDPSPDTEVVVAAFVSPFNSYHPYPALTYAENLTVSKTTTAPVIDGDLSDWNLANTLSPLGSTVPSDSKFNLKWDDTYLYVATEVKRAGGMVAPVVTDGTVTTPGTRISYFFDPIGHQSLFTNTFGNPPKSGLELGDVQIIIQYNPNDVTKPYITFGGGGPFAKQTEIAANTNAVLKANTAGDGYNVEAAFRWADLLITPKNDEYFAFEIFDEDNLKWASNGKTESFWNKSDNYGKITLSAPAIQDQAAPTGLIAIVPTSSANNDGKITGVSTAMEYKLSTATTYTAVTGTEITGLAPGTYNVRYAAKDGYNASPDTDVTVAEYVSALSSIAITTPPAKTTYLVGEKLDLTGLVVTGTYSGGTTKEETVTASNITGFDSSAPAASQTVTVTVDGKTASFQITVRTEDLINPVFDTKEAASPVTIDGKPDESAWEFIHNETISIGAQDNSAKFATLWDQNYLYLAFDVTDDELISSTPSATLPWGADSVDLYINGNNSVKGAYTANTAQYIICYGGADNSAYLFQSSVTPKTATTTGLLSKTIDKVDGTGKTVGYTMEVAIPWTCLGGLSVTAGKEIGFTAHVNDMDSGFDPNADNLLRYTTPPAVSGEDDWCNSSNWGTMILTSGSVTTPVLNSIAITTPAAKTTFKVGEALDISGMVVTGAYSDGSFKTESVTTANVSGFDSSAATASQTLTVTVNGKTVTYNISVINNDQAAPSDMGVIAPTTTANNDGQIISVREGMEYKLSTASTYTAVTADQVSTGKITGLVPGTYNIRYAAKPGYNASTDTNVVVPPYSPTAVAAPTINRLPTTFGGTYNVRLACSTSGAVIHYTTDGTTPTASSPIYTTGGAENAAASYISLTATTTIKAIAVASGMADSPVSEFTFTKKASSAAAKALDFLTDYNASGVTSPDGTIFTKNADGTVTVKITAAKADASTTDNTLNGVYIPVEKTINFAENPYLYFDVVPNASTTKYAFTLCYERIDQATNAPKDTKFYQMAGRYNATHGGLSTDRFFTAAKSDKFDLLNDYLNDRIYQNGSLLIKGISVYVIGDANASVQINNLCFSSDGLIFAQAAPTGLTGTAPTSSTNNDGKINNTTTAMEYKLSTASTYTAVIGTQITGLAAGTYNVRFMAKTGYNASPAADVTVPAYVAPTLTGIAITTQPTKKTYKVGETLDITGMVVTGTYSNSTSKTETVTTANVSGFNSNAATASQTLTVTVGGKTATYTIAIVNNDQTAPTGLAGSAPTSIANNDGKITGTTTAMEYKLSTASTYTAATATQITGLAAGTYNVRLAAKAGYNASPAADVVVPAYVAPTLTSIAITTSPTKLTYKIGEALDITGMVVTGTYSDNSTKTESVTDANVTGFDSTNAADSQTLTVTVGDKTAEFTVQIIEEQLFTASIKAGYGGSIKTGTSGNYAKDDVISLAAVSNAYYIFSGWTTTGGGKFENAGNSTTTFTMPSANVTITANFKRRIGGGVGIGVDYNSGSQSQTQTDTPTGTITDTTTQPIQTEDHFNDLNGYDWAKDSINALAESGVINGTSAKTFTPGSNVTRADFTVLLVRALDLESDSTDNFSDVNANDYFAKELAIAKGTGIITGIGDNKYAPKGQISRQDMMVIVVRALEKAGFVLTAGSADDLTAFSDGGEIAGYAKDAVATLVKDGIITGANGKINPNGKASRAEVAVLISRILNNKK